MLVIIPSPATSQAASLSLHPPLPPLLGREPGRVSPWRVRHTHPHLARALVFFGHFDLVGLAVAKAREAIQAAVSVGQGGGPFFHDVLPLFYPKH